MPLTFQVPTRNRSPSDFTFGDTRNVAACWAKTVLIKLDFVLAKNYV